MIRKTRPVTVHLSEAQAEALAAAASFVLAGEEAEPDDFWSDTEHIEHLPGAQVLLSAALRAASRRQARERR